MEDYLIFAKTLAHEAGDVMRHYFLAVDRTWKDDATPLTQADTEINDLVIKTIREKYPEHSIHGEEKSDYRDSKYLWVCDPVDGTVPYSSGISASTFSLALVIDGVSTVGVVYDPFNDRLFHAIKGGGAFMNDVSIHVSDQASLVKTVINIEGLHYSSRGEVSLSNSLRDVLMDRGVRPLQLWSAVLSSVLVAQGMLTAVIMNVQTIQDGAAIKVIVDEAGGKVTDIHGNDQRYDEPSRGFIASNGLVHEELVKIIASNRLS